MAILDVKTSCDKHLLAVHFPDGQPAASESASLIAETMAGLGLILPLGQVTELRALGVRSSQHHSPRVVGGYYEDVELLASDAVDVSQDACGVYFVPNPIDPQLIARCRNRCRPVFREPLTADANILRRRNLLVDLDPVRPSGISSTEEELAAALTRASEVINWLTIQGWSDPTVALSGNGVHLIYAMDLAVDDGGLSQRILHALAMKFDDDQVLIDPKTHRPAQLFKVPGTWARKGDDLAARPHRRAQILFAPPGRDLVPHALLERIAALAPAQRRGQPPRHSRGALDVEQWIAEHELDVEGPREWQAGRRWIFRACPWNPEHTNRAAYIVQLANGAIAAGCHHASCAGKGWHDLRDVVEAGWRERGGGGNHLILPPSTHPAIRREFLRAARIGVGRRGA